MVSILKFGRYPHTRWSNTKQQCQTRGIGLQLCKTNCFPRLRSETSAEQNHACFRLRRSNEWKTVPMLRERSLRGKHALRKERSRPSNGVALARWQRQRASPMRKLCREESRGRERGRETMRVPCSPGVENMRGGQGRSRAVAAALVVVQSR